MHSQEKQVLLIRVSEDGICYCKYTQARHFKNNLHVIHFISLSPTWLFDTKHSWVLWFPSNQGQKGGEHSFLSGAHHLSPHSLVRPSWLDPLEKSLPIPSLPHPVQCLCLGQVWPPIPLPLGLASGHHCSCTRILQGGGKKKNSFKTNQERKMIKVLFSYQCVCRPRFFRSKKKRSEGRVRADSSAGKRCSLQGAPHLPVFMPFAPFLMLTLLLPPPGGRALPPPNPPRKCYHLCSSFSRSLCRPTPICTCSPEGIVRYGIQMISLRDVNVLPFTGALAF